jgi:hypothetical protein
MKCIKHPETKADKKNHPQDSKPKVAVYIRVGSASQLENQGMERQSACFDQQGITPRLEGK